MTGHLVHVFLEDKLGKRPVGRLLLQNRKIFFEYDTSFLKSGLELSPFKLPLQRGVISSSDQTFEGLFGVFNDSLPDGWGRLLLDRKLLSLGQNPHHLSPLDRLCFVGSKGMGALVYVPENSHHVEDLFEDLDDIHREIQSFQDGESDLYVDHLLELNGSSAGARPKILLKKDGKEWLIKFRSSFDSKECGVIEYAYHLMAKEAGLEVPPAKLFPSQKGPGFFGVARFDCQQGSRIHMHSLSGLLHADHREPSLDYQTLMKATLFLTRHQGECEKQFRNAVFNVLGYNRDDHSKNFSFLMDEKGTWRVSPAYDLTFSSGPGGEHVTMVMGEGKNPTKEHLLTLALIGDIQKKRASEIIEQVQSVIHKWKTFADLAGVSQKERMRIQESLCRKL